MRQLAYYHAVPSGSEKARIETVMRDINDNPILDLPKIGKEIYLVSLLYSAGTHAQTGNGIVGLSWQEIKAWQEVTGFGLYSWELQIIKEMSRAYATEYYQACQKGAEPPYSRVKNIREKRKQVSDATLELFDKIIKIQEDKECLTKSI